MDVNPDEETIEVNGITFSVENRPNRFLPVLIGRFYCGHCFETTKTIDNLSDYGYLLQKYQEHVKKCIKKT